jgi:5-methylcytosine-specific restriction endonuclease McrA
MASQRGRSTTLDRLYEHRKWRRIRRLQLGREPLCVFCLRRGIVTTATVCDHITPHAGDVNKFWLGPFQSLCAACHNSDKRLIERGKRPRLRVGLDGYPIEPEARCSRDFTYLLSYRSVRRITYVVK